MEKETKDTKRIWILGASTGIGLALCKLFLDKGYQVVASSRSAETEFHLAQLKKNHPQNLQRLNIDIQEMDSLPEKCRQAWETFQGLDIWFYNIGLYEPMKMADWEYREFLKMNQANYLGAVALMLELQPLFLKQTERTRVHWIWNISLASDFGLPYGGGYSAPKAALMNLAESIQPELAETNIQLQVINHGFVKTRLTAKNNFSMLGLIAPEEAAARIFHKIDTAIRNSAAKPIRNRDFEIRFPWNLASLLAFIKRLPKAWALSLTRKMLKKESK